MSSQMSSNAVKEGIDFANYSKQEIAELIKRGRLKSKLTQKELAQRSGITIRAVQRIENAMVMPRGYTLHALLEHIDASSDATLSEELPLKEKFVTQKSSRTSKLILTFGCPILLFIGAYAFILQSPTFPETTFELFVFIFCLGLLYMLFLAKLWK